MTQALKIVFIVIPCLSGVFSYAQSLPTNKLEEIILPITELEIYEDKSGLVDFNKILKGNIGFYTPKRFDPADYNVNSSYWVRLSIDLNNKRDREWIIEFYDQTIDYLEAYVPRSNGSFQKMSMGDQYPFNEKSFHHKNFEILIDPHLEGVQNFYFKIESHTYADIRIAIKSVNRFIAYATFEYFLYGLFYGMVAIIILYNLLVFLAIREVKYLYYTFYILSVALYAMCVDGIAYQYLWPSMPQWNQIAHGTALFMLIFWALIFGQRFLNAKNTAPRLYNIIWGVTLLRTLFYFYALFFDNSLFQLRNIEIMPLSFIFYEGIYVLIRGYKPARFFVMAYGVLFLGFLIKAMLNLSLIPFSIVSYYSLHICFILEMLFLTFALSDRIRILKSNRDRALKRIIIQHQDNVKLKDKVNKELESLVNKRTAEIQEKNMILEETNQKLNQQTNEISKINSILDLDNWKLKNNIKEILQDRLINKNLTLQEFNKIFPDEISCYRFLDRLKWGSGFSCTKCGNGKYTHGQSKYSRRCTRCGYDESITSNTVFHRLRFPIEKAFYILYITNNRQNKLTLDRLSEMLDLRRNTVWNFKKKIEKVFSEKEDSHLIITDLFSKHLHQKTSKEG